MSLVDSALGGKWDSLWVTFFVVTICVPTVAVWKILVWSGNNWANHPIAKQLSVFANPNTSWTSVAADINDEYRR